MEIYNWLLLLLAIGALLIGGSAVLTGLRGIGQREYGGGILFLLLGLCFSAAALYTAYVATLGPSPDT
jgi:hypothetical protein